jgi:two-component system, sensor histidine kinase and response regulator
MKPQLPQTLSLPEKLRFSSTQLFQVILKQAGRKNFDRLQNVLTGLKSQLMTLIVKVKAIGNVHDLDNYEKRKLGIFNLLNFFQFISGIIVPVFVLAGNEWGHSYSWLLACTPAFISLAVLLLNHYGKYDTARIIYFLLYPFFTSIVYMGGMNLGVELSFIMYGILSVFFLQDIGRMLFSVSLSMISYFMLAVVLKRYQFQLEQSNYFFYLFNQVLAIIIIFYGLYLIKKENVGYEFKILSNNRALHASNLAIQEQKKEIAEKAGLLEKQKEELSELNSLKNQLFSVIAHDLKTPMYALRNLFRGMQQYDVAATDIKAMVPDVVNDLNYTTSLMDNLLQWAKSQMYADAVKPQHVDVAQLTDEAIQLLRLQAETKNIRIQNKIDFTLSAFADKEMVHLVLRNLLSNAIKFTPQNGEVTIEGNETGSFAEIFIKDSGTGIDVNALKQIKKNIYYSTKGTASESGTGLGLMLCREFLLKNGGQMFIESEPGKGSIFSFTLPRN